MDITSDPLVVFLETKSIPKRIGIPPIREPHQLQQYDITLPDQVVERLQGATVAVVNKVVLDEKVLSVCPSVKFIALSATGLNNIDLDYCQRNGIGVKNVMGYAQHTVAEHVFMMLLALQRKLFDYHRDVCLGKWSESELFYLNEHEIIDLRGLTLGIIGGGSIAQRVAAIAQSFGMRIQFLERKARTEVRANKVDFITGLKCSDVLSIHCPLTEDTKDLIDRQEFMLMKKNVVLINTARGGIVNEEALVEAVNHGKIKAVALDVVNHEPMSKDDPLMKIVNKPNVIITPHCAWLSDSALSQLVKQLVLNIESFLAKP